MKGLQNTTKGLTFEHQATLSAVQAKSGLLLTSGKQNKIGSLF